MEKTISIIIATYNAGKTLQKCLDSIAKQKSDDIELIVIDGASKDDTLEIVKRNSAIIDQYVSERDKGIYDAWNKGIARARGKWIQFIGADDVLLDGAIGFYKQYLQSCDDVESYDIIFGRCWLVDETGRKIRKMGDPYDWNQFRRFMRVSHGSALHNRKLFEEIGLFSLDFKICADYELLLRKKLRAKYVDREIIAMQLGGMSYSVKGLLDSYKVKKYHKTLPSIVNNYYLIKGMIGLWVKNTFLNKL